MQEVEGKEEEREGQVEVEATQGCALMDDYGDEMTRFRSLANEV